MYLKIVIFLLLLLSSCTRNTDDNILNKARQTKIIIPYDSLLCLQPRVKGITMNIKNNSDYQYVVYCDSSICSLCELQQMGIWNGIIQRAHEIDVPIDFVFIFNPPKTKVNEFVEGYYIRKYNMTVFVDTNGIVLKKNDILNNSLLHSFILKKNNRIVKIGNASKNEKVEQEFYKFLKNVKE